MDDISATQFGRLVTESAALHFAKRLAHSEPNGAPSSAVLSNPSQQYVMEVLNHLYAVRSAVRDSESLVDQVRIPPPEPWLREMCLDADRYRQQLLDLFTIVIHSVLDRTLLLTNVVCRLEIAPRDCSLRAIAQATLRTGLSISNELVSLREAVLPIADARHLFAHRGEHRDAGVFSAVQRAKLITQGMHADTTGLVFNDTGAVAGLLRIMEADLRSVSAPLVRVLSKLCVPFDAALDSIGGPDIPSAEELSKAKAMIEYFAGGERPGFLSR